jgi:Type I restriction enzyme HindI endonuclease subunit-like, C-terminal
VVVKRILNRFGYPPDLQEEAVKTVLMQCRTEIMLEREFLKAEVLRRFNRLNVAHVVNADVLSLQLR